MTQESPSGQDNRTRLGVGSAVVLALGGVVLGVFGAFLQAYTVTLGSVAIPVGAVVLLACLVACIRALVHSFESRAAGAAFFLGWVVASVVLAIPTAGGDIVIALTPVAVGYLFAGVVIGSACANVPARLRTRESV